MVQQLCNILRDDVSDYLHKYIHFDTNVTLALVYVQHADARKMITGHIRDTDRLVRISTHLYAVFFQYTDTDSEADAAVRNLEAHIQETSGALIAYTHFHESDKEPDAVVIRLYEIFEALFKKEEGTVASDADYFREFMKNHITTEDL